MWRASSWEPSALVGSEASTSRSRATRLRCGADSAYVLGTTFVLYVLFTSRENKDDVEARGKDKSQVSAFFTFTFVRNVFEVDCIQNVVRVYISIKDI